MIELYYAKALDYNVPTNMPREYEFRDVSTIIGKPNAHYASFFKYTPGQIKF